jgi:hypothetical protein
MSANNFYILREVWTETYNCPDEGLVNICETYVDIKISTDMQKLQKIADELNRGIKGEFWSATESNRLRSLYAGYDDMKDSKFVVEDITELFSE